MSVGHVARALEESSLSTVIIAVRSFRVRMEMMSLPRVLLTDNIMGRVLGQPGDTQAQRAILGEALQLLENANSNGAIVDSEYSH